MYLCSYARVAKEEFTLRDLKKKLNKIKKWLTLKYLITILLASKINFLQKSAKILSCWKFI